MYQTYEKQEKIVVKDDSKVIQDLSDLFRKYTVFINQ